MMVSLLESLKDLEAEIEKRDVALAELEIENERLKKGIFPPTIYCAYHERTIDPITLGNMIMKTVKKEAKGMGDGKTKEIMIMFRVAP